ERPAAERTTVERAAEEQARRDKEQLSPKQIAKAEELANWEFIKESTRRQDFRDHLARFPDGVCERWARAKLEILVWAALGASPDKAGLSSYLEEFSDGAHAEEARSRAARLRSEERKAFEAAKRRDHADAIDKFLAAFPDCDYVEEA